jgi:hypothetical protein
MYCVMHARWEARRCGRETWPQLDRVDVAAFVVAVIECMRQLCHVTADTAHGGTMDRVDYPGFSF